MTEIPNTALEQLVRTTRVMVLAAAQAARNLVVASPRPSAWVPFKVAVCTTLVQSTTALYGDRLLKVTNTYQMVIAETKDI